MKTTKQDFEFFKQECLELATAWNLDDWEINFHHQNPDNKYADASVSKDSIYRRVDIKLSVDHFDSDTFNREYIKGIAKHEMIHILLGDLSATAHSREASHDQINQAEEMAVRKLEKLL